MTDIVEKLRTEVRDWVAPHMRQEMMKEAAETLDQAEIEARKFYIERNALLEENKKLQEQIKTLNKRVTYYKDMWTATIRVRTPNSPSE